MDRPAHPAWRVCRLGKGAANENGHSFAPSGILQHEYNGIRGFRMPTYPWRNLKQQRKGARLRCLTPHGYRVPPPTTIDQGGHVQSFTSLSPNLQI